MVKGCTLRDYDALVVFRVELVTLAPMSREVKVEHYHVRPYFAARLKLIDIPDQLERSMVVSKLGRFST